MKRIVVFGLLGTTLDASDAISPKRWMKWRPSVDLCRHEDFKIDRFELLHPTSSLQLLQTVVNDIAQVSPETEVRTHPIDMGDPWGFEQVFASLMDFARSYSFSTQEDYFVHITTGTHVMQICLFLLTESRFFPARLLQSSPPNPRDRGQPGTYRIIDLDLSKYDRLASRFSQQKLSDLDFLKSGIATKNPPFNQLIEKIERVAIASKAPLLLTGATGVGKTQLARRIYELKHMHKQVQGAFIEVNCATLRGDLAMSTLFGHVRGAFTGAVNQRIGVLRRAHQGVLFLDEIGELGLDEQAMLLRAIEDRRYQMVGGEKEEHSEFQLIAGSNRDLAEEVRHRRFREDLLARINLWTFCLPSLRERTEDIAPNLDYELERWNRTGRGCVRLTRPARTRFLAFATAKEAVWTANFRDFAAAVERMATLAQGGRITTEVVEEEIARLQQMWKKSKPDQSEDAPSQSLSAFLPTEEIAAIDPFDQVQLAYAIQICRSSENLSDAGRELFSVSRKRRKMANDSDRLRKYLSKFGLSWQDLFRTKV